MPVRREVLPDKEPLIMIISLTTFGAHPKKLSKWVLLKTGGVNFPVNCGNEAVSWLIRGDNMLCR